MSRIDELQRLHEASLHSDLKFHDWTGMVDNSWPAIHRVLKAMSDFIAVRQRELAMAIDARDGAERASRRQFNDIRALTRERDAARAEAEKLRTELDEAVNAELAHKAKWESICSASRENGTCACSYDSIDDVCMAHSPKLAAAMADLAAARSEAEHERRAGQEMTAGLHEKLAEVRAELAAVKRQRDALVAIARHVVFEGLTANHEPPYLIPSEKLRERLIELHAALAAEQPKPIEPAPCACCDKPASHIGSDGMQRCSDHALNGEQPKPQDPEVQP